MDGKCPVYPGDGDGVGVGVEMLCRNGDAFFISCPQIAPQMQPLERFSRLLPPHGDGGWFKFCLASVCARPVISRKHSAA